MIYECRATGQKYRANENSRYAEYESHVGWRSSASVTNENLTNKIMYKEVK